MDTPAAAPHRHRAAAKSERVLLLGLGNTFLTAWLLGKRGSHAVDALTLH